MASLQLCCKRLKALAEGVVEPPQVAEEAAKAAEQTVRQEQREPALRGLARRYRPLEPVAWSLAEASGAQRRVAEHPA